MSELLPTRTVALEYVDCTDPTREYEFNRWYNKVHVPDLEMTRGIVSVYRYRNVATELREGQARYLTIYRINSDDPWGLMQELSLEGNKKMAEQGRMIDYKKTHLMTVWEFLVFRRTVSPRQHPEPHLPDGMPEAIFVVPTSCTDPARQDEFYDWYLYTHFHDLLETPGLVQAHRYRTLDPHPEAVDARYLALYEIDSDDPAAVVRQILEDDRNIRIPQGRMINCIRAGYGFGTYRHIDI